MTGNANSEEFTEGSYRTLIRAVAERYGFEPFGTDSEEPHVLWRHDVDASVHRALALARIEAEAGVRATYFLHLHAWFYNLLEPAIVERAREILRLGHWLGLHFEVGFYPEIDDEETLARHLAYERELLENLFGRPVGAFSFHDPETGPALDFDSDVIAGMVNAYGRRLRERYAYISDSNGYWRFTPLPDVITAASEPRLHVLTHPEWWQREPMPPRERIQRCIDGRARSVASTYDEALARAGRQNLA
jgi:hypothetical protein